MHPRFKLYIGILSISFFPIVFYFFSEKVHLLLAVFLLFMMVFLLSSPAIVREIRRESIKYRGEDGKSGGIRGAFLYLKESLTPKVSFVLLVISGITILGNFLVVYALSHKLSPSVVQTILRSETVFVSLGGVFIFKEIYPRSLPWVIILIIIGFSVMGFETLFQKAWDWQHVYILHVLVASFCFGSFQIVSKFIIHDLNVYVLNGLRSFINCLILLPWVYPYFSELNIEVLFFALLSAIAGPFLGRNIILSCTRDLPLNYIGCNLSITPIFSMGLQWLFLHNLPSAYEMIGGTIIIFSVLLFNLNGLQKNFGSRFRRVKGED